MPQDQFRIRTDEETLESLKNPYVSVYDLVPQDSRNHWGNDCIGQNYPEKAHSLKTETEEFLKGFDGI